MIVLELPANFNELKQELPNDNELRVFVNNLKNYYINGNNKRC